MAELYFNERCRQMGYDGLAAASAGTWAGDGQTISEPAAAVMAECGIDAAAFRSRAFRRSLATEYDRIVGMTYSHCRDVLESAPEAAGKVTRLLGDRDVADPFGGTEEEYRQTFMMMKPALDALADRLFSQPKS